MWRGQIYLTLTMTGTNDNKWKRRSEETTKRRIRRWNNGRQGAILALTTLSAKEINATLENLTKNGWLTDKQARHKEQWISLRRHCNVSGLQDWRWMCKKTELRKTDTKASRMAGTDKPERSTQNAVDTVWETTIGARWTDMKNCVKRIEWHKTT